MEVAKRGMTEESVTGRGVEPLFAQTAFRLDYLTEPTGFMDLGLDLKKVNVADKVQADDSGFVVAYPHFNVNGARSSELP